MGDAF